MGSGYQQDVDQLQLFSDVSVYNNIINKPEQAEMVVDMACRAALSQRGVSHFTMPIDVQEKILEGKYSKHKVPGHTSDKLINFDIMPSSQKTLKDAAEILNAGKKIVIFIGQGALNARNEVLAIAEKLNAPIVKSLLGKAVVEDDNPYNIGILGILGTEPATDAMNEADTLLMVGTSFPYIDYLPKPGQARGIQIDIKPERIGIRYPVEIGLLGDSKVILSALIPLLKNKEQNNNLFLKEKQRAMQKWTDKLQQFRNIDNTNSISKSLVSDTKVIKPQVIAAAVSEELEDNAIISVDSGTNTFWAARHINVRSGMKFSVSGTLASM